MSFIISVESFNLMIPYVNVLMMCTQGLRYQQRHPVEGFIRTAQASMSLWPSLYDLLPGYRAARSDARVC
jgi:hypothetical protein